MASARKTAIFFKDGDYDVVSDDWKSLRPTSKQRGKWKGYTDFYVPASELKKLPSNYGGPATYVKSEAYNFLAVEPDIFLGKKAGSDEVSERDILPHEWEQWRLAHGEEWSKIAASPAVSGRVKSCKGHGRQGRPHFEEPNGSPA